MEIREGLLGQPVELAGLDVVLDLLVEARAIERRKPVAELGELIRRQLGDGLFEVLDGHAGRITSKSPFVAVRNTRGLRPRRYDLLRTTSS
jgi:hypothetical protein